jgi:hypothetical protein
MLTGRPAFEGDTITDILGAIVKSEPDWTMLPPATPPGVRQNSSASTSPSACRD